MPAKRIWTEEEDRFLKDNYAALTMSRLIMLLPKRSKASIIQRAMKHGLSIGKSHRHYYVNDNYFDILDNESAYHGGLIAADGSLNLKRSQISLVLKSSDLPTLEDFKAKIQFDGPIHQYILKSGHYAGTEISKIRVISQQWLHDLHKHFNITPRKSLTLTAPNISDPALLKSYIVGYLDGDGYISKFNRSDRPAGYYLGFGFTGTEHTLSFIKHFFDKTYYCRRPANLQKLGNVFTYKIVGVRAQEILKDLDALKLSKMDRKWSKILEVNNV